MSKSNGLKGLGPIILAACLTLPLAGCWNREPEEPIHVKKVLVPYFKTHWQDESQFIVETILTDITEMAYYAKNKSLPPTPVQTAALEKKDSAFRVPEYEVSIVVDPKIPPITFELKIDGPIWAPETYDNACKGIFAALGLQKTESFQAPETNALLALEDLTAMTIEKQNQEVSQLLQQDFTNPLLHERAALVVGAFAFRESSGCFYEIRSSLCRMTSHMTLARGLSGSNAYGADGFFADTILFTLMNNGSIALDKIAHFDASSPEAQVWARALKVRNTHDYRILANEKNPTRVEKIEYFRALCSSLHPVVAMDRFDLKDQEMVADWPRIISSHEYSVSIGHFLWKAALPLEFQELSSTYQLIFHKKLEQNHLVDELNKLPERCFSSEENSKVQIHAIGWGQWAMFFQRHLCHTITCNFDFLEDKWGVHDQAKTFSAQMDKLFDGVRLYPFARFLNAIESKSFQAGIDGAMKVSVNTPEFVSPEIWNDMWYAGRFGEFYHPNPNPHGNEWHKHNPPPGTAYDPLPRMNHGSLISRADVVSQLEKLHEMAPYDENIAYNLIRVKFKDAGNFEQLEEIYRPTMEYCSWAVHNLAKGVEKQPEAYEKVLRQEVTLDPFAYYRLGELYRGRGEDDKAAECLEKGRELWNDSVKAASVDGWLVRYYQKKGNIEKAIAIADEAAEVYSKDGLESKADLLDSLGKYDGALEYYKKIEERYENGGPLLRFLARYKEKTGDLKYETDYQSRITKIFPDGLKKVTLADFKDPPKDGVLIKEQNELLLKNGLKKRDVIVACEQIHVHNFEQYDYARNLTKVPELTLIAWRKGKYFEVHATVPEHRFGVDMGPYVTK